MMESLSNIGRLSDPLKAAASAPSILKWMRARVRTLINATHQRSRFARGVAAQAGDHGLPPSKVSAFVHAGITHHYFNGGYYPLGGAFALPRAFVRALKKSGGEIRLQCRVKRILVEGKKVIGVELDSGEEIRSSVVISNADPEACSVELIGKEKLSPRLKTES
ncbi:MAG: FAD-dependent oxidoreductase [Anaerolineales bacterium]|nr:FAD-dependent oxidoreductase [Anaerolineales bacterium]